MQAEMKLLAMGAPQGGSSNLSGPGGDSGLLPGLPGQAGSEGGGSANVKNKPKLIVSNYSLSPEMPKAGEEFTLNLTFYNTNAYKSVRNIKISLNSAEMSQGAGGTPVAGGAVFSPVGSSNTFYIRSIAPEKTVSKQISLKTTPTVQAQSYNMTVSYEYEDLEGNEFTATENIGIPVVQNAQILLGDLMLDGGKTKDTSIAMGQPLTVDLDFYNIGKDTLSTFMVTVEGEGFTTNDSPRRFVGNFAPGASDHYNTEIIANDPSMKAKIKISYEDSTGQKHEEEIPIEVNVEETGMPEGVDPSKLEYDEKTGTLVDPKTKQHYNAETLQPVDPQNYKTNSSGSWLMGLVLAAIVCVLAAVIYIRRRKKKKDAQEMDLDV